MIQIFPFLAGTIMGAVGVMVFGSGKSKGKIQEGKIYVENKLQDGKESVVAIAECVKEKINKAKKEDEPELNEEKEGQKEDERPS